MSFPKNHRPPREYIDMKLCEKFGWTPQQLDQQDDYIIGIWLKMMEVEYEYQEKKSGKNNTQPKFRK